MSELVIGGRTFRSRLFVGTGKFSSNELMARAIAASESEMVTVAMKRIDMNNPQDDMLVHVRRPEIQLLPNTSGVRDAEEAVLAAQLAREAFGTNFIKLEIHPDPKYLLPDPVETLKATEQLAKMGFVVLPYIQADPVLCKRLEEAGAATVMPLAAPIGTNKGLVTRDLLAIIIEQSNVPVIVDAGLGAPSHAAAAMEMGADAVLVNTAIAVAGDPVRMARAFAQAVVAGREAYEAGLGAQAQCAEASSPSHRISRLIPPRYVFRRISQIRLGGDDPANSAQTTGRRRDGARQGTPDPRRLHGAHLTCSGRLPGTDGPAEPPIHTGAVRQDYFDVYSDVYHQLVHELLHLLRIQPS